MNKNTGLLALAALAVFVLVQKNKTPAQIAEAKQKHRML